VQQPSDEPGFRPPQQARSRESLRKVLAATEQVLAELGVDEFTVAEVADRAALSVGAIYRRFSGKEQLLAAVKDQLLGELETSVGDALRSPGPELRDTVRAFVEALATTFAQHGRVFPDLLDSQRADGRDRALESLAAIQRSFAEAVQSGMDGVRRADQERAVRTAARNVLGACVHRAATERYWPDGLDWETWAAETAQMTLAYLTSPEGR
jgi:AcrR family transcriptional regulator